MPVGLSPRMEDYLEAILVVQQRRPVARVGEIAETLHVSQPTVTSALKTLAEGGLIEHQSYGYIELTQEGRKAAEKVREHHRLLRTFFERVLGVSAEQAARDACSAEHYISRQTLQRLTRFIGFIDNCPRTGPEWLERFRCFCEGGDEERAANDSCGEACLEGCMQELKSGHRGMCKMDRVAFGGPAADTAEGHGTQRSADDV